MKKHLLILYFLCLPLSFCLAQDYKQTLIGKTWRITLLQINGEAFTETQGTCVYSTEITFVNDALLTLNRPCLGVTQQSHRIMNNLLILNNSDTLTITKLSLTSFETTTRQKATDDKGNVSIMNIITTYEKE